MILSPLKENPDWVEPNFLASLGDFLVDEIWNLSGLKVPTANFSTDNID